MQAIKNDITIDEHVIKTLLYYDIFNYPLKANEVFRFLDVPATSEQDVIQSLEALVEERSLFRFGEFYSIQSNESNVHRRIKGNREAEKYLEMARRKALLIARFPFVRAVLASGSLSKGYMDEKSDLDFFIVTEPGRLWIARMMLVLYKRVFLFNSHKYFCVNYFVDSAHLEIEEKNLFTATELATVIPLYGAAYYQQLQSSNVWLKNFFPNYKPRSIEAVNNNPSGWIKKLTEKVINICFGDTLEKFFMGLTLKRWKRIYEKDYPEADFKVAFKSKKHASKNHPNHYQRKVLETYQQKIDQFLKKFDTNGHE